MRRHKKIQPKKGILFWCVPWNAINIGSVIRWHYFSFNNSWLAPQNQRTPIGLGLRPWRTWEVWWRRSRWYGLIAGQHWSGQSLPGPKLERGLIRSCNNKLFQTLWVFFVCVFLLASVKWRASCNVIEAICAFRLMGGMYCCGLIVVTKWALLVWKNAYPHNYSWESSLVDDNRTNVL